MWFAHYHCRDLRHGYDHPLRYMMTTQVLKASKPSSQCHSEGVIALSSLLKVRDWVTAVGVETAYIEPGSHGKPAAVRALMRVFEMRC